MLPAKVAGGGARHWGVSGGGGCRTLQGWWHIPKSHLFLSLWDSRVLFPSAPALVGMEVVMVSAVQGGIGVAVGHLVSLSTSSVVVVGSPTCSRMSSRCVVLWCPCSPFLRMRAGNKCH